MKDLYGSCNKVRDEYTLIWIRFTTDTDTPLVSLKWGSQEKHQLFGDSRGQT